MIVADTPITIPCTALHGARYCRAIELRHAALILRRSERKLIAVVGMPAPHRRPLSWKIGKVYRHVEWLRDARLPELRMTVRAATNEATAIKIAADRYHLSYWGMRRVGGCESTGDATGHDLNRWATNGWYLGLFQEGPSVRASYLRGHWANALENALAAARTVVADGNWGQWSCGWAYYS